MDEKDLYFNVVEENNIRYTCDMLRIKSYLTYNQFSEIEFRFKTCYVKYVDKFYTTGKISQFFYNYVIDVGEEHTFWFGFLHNNEKRSQSEKAEYNFTIEFNPNKIRDNKILLWLLSFSADWYIVSYDLAFDLKINILDIIYDQYQKRESKVFSLGNDNKTIYFGKGNGRTKIYNKKIESNLNIEHSLTRVEVSRTLEDYPINEMSKFDFGDFLPRLYLNRYLYTFSDYKDRTMLAILYAVQNGFPVKELSRVYREKISKMFEGGCKVNFNKDCATVAVRQTIFHYFIKDARIKFR